MKKIITLFSLVFVMVALTNAQTTYTFSPTTYSSQTAVTTLCTYSFSNSCTISNNNTKAYGTGSITSPATFSGIKFSAGTQYTITFPSAISIKSIVVNGYDNYNGKKSYFSEINGTTTSAWNDSTQYFLTAKTVSGTTTTAVMSSVTFTYDVPVTTSTFTFTPAGNQMVVSFTINPTSTGVENITANLDMNKPTNVYAIDGRRIKTNVIRSLALEGLQNGVYIIDNKKVVINKN
jgi:hypothetical protein